jgi:hypothetical protein
LFHTNSTQMVRFSGESTSSINILDFASLNGASTNLSFPIATIAGIKVNFAINFYGVKTGADGQIDDMSSIELWYRADVKVKMTINRKI